MRPLSGMVEFYEYIQWKIIEAEEKNNGGWLLWLFLGGEAWGVPGPVHQPQVRLHDHQGPSGRYPGDCPRPGEQPQGETFDAVISIITQNLFSVLRQD